MTIWMLPPEALRTNRFERGRAGTPARPLFVCIAVATYYSSPAKAGKKLTGTWLHDRQTRLSRYEAGEHRRRAVRSEEHTSELQSLMRISYAVFCLKQKIYYTMKQLY